MSTSHPTLANLGIVAQLFERMDRHASRVDAAQYRAVAGRLSQMLAESAGEPGLDELLDKLPAVRELYENLHYAEAGLCRSPLDAAVDAEVRAHDAIERIRSAAAKPAPRSAGADEDSVA